MLQQAGAAGLRVERWKKILGYLVPPDWLGDGLYQALSTDYKVAVSFGILIMVLLFRPQGIFGGK